MRLALMATWHCDIFRLILVLLLGFTSTEVGSYASSQQIPSAQSFGGVQRGALTKQSWWGFNTPKNYMYKCSMFVDRYIYMNIYACVHVSVCLSVCVCVCLFIMAEY